MRNKIPLFALALVATVLACGSAGAESNFEAILDAERLLDQAEELLTQENYGQAISLCNQVIEKHSSTAMLSEAGFPSYGALAEREKTEILCRLRKAGQTSQSSRSALAAALVKALRTADAAKLEKLLDCGVGRAAATSDHKLLFDTVSLAQELTLLRKQDGALLPFSADGTDFIATSGYADGLVRRFELVRNRQDNEWYVESFIEGAPDEVAALPATMLAPAPPRLTPAQKEELRQDFALYTDPDGLVVSEPNPGINTSGNGLLYTSYYYLSLRLYGILTDDDRARFTQTVQACRKDQINGLYNRSPTKTDQEGPDDYYGLIAASAIDHVNAPIAIDIYKYGTAPRPDPFRWVFNNVHPGKFTISAWLGRQPHLVAHSELSLHKRPAIWRRLVWMGAVGFSKTSNPGGNQDVMLTWLLASNTGSRPRDLKLVAKDWKRRMLASYPNGMRDVFARYFNNPNHPLAKWALTDFGWQY